MVKLQRAQVFSVTCLLLFPVFLINFHIDDLRITNDERIGKQGFWSRLSSGQLWLDLIYGKAKVTVSLWNFDLKLESLAIDEQQVIVKVAKGEVSQLEKDFPDATVSYLYNDTIYSYVVVEDKLTNIACKFWQHVVGFTSTLADKPYVQQISLNQRMSLVVPLAYAEDDDICRTTYGLCDDYGILDTNYSGHGIKIAVLDTGINRNHLGFVNITAGTATIIYNESFVSGEDWVDHNGHGTHCIGIIAGQNTQLADGIPMRGVAPNATIYSIKVLDSHGQGTEADIVSGIMRAVDLNVDIISMSLGGTIDYFSALHDVIEYAVGKGVVVVAAAGNSGDVVSAQPASWEGVISVEALKEDKHIAAYTCLSGDIAAEGTNITSLDYKSVNGTSTKSGTSMATPFVAGCIALLLEAQPSLRGRPERVTEYLKATGAFAPASPAQVNLIGFIPVTASNYCYDTREVNPVSLVGLDLVIDTAKQQISDVRTQLLRNDGV